MSLMNNNNGGGDECRDVCAYVGSCAGVFASEHSPLPLPLEGEGEGEADANMTVVTPVRP